jgi:tetratricopeptide (TPR) repeat protein
MSVRAEVEGRFEARGLRDGIWGPWGARLAALKATFRRGFEAPPSEELLGLRGVDCETGAPVLIEPRGPDHTWQESLVHDAMARLAAALASPYLVPVLHVGPGVVYFRDRVDNGRSIIAKDWYAGPGVVRAEPPPGLARGAFTVPEAATLALQACTVAASLHAVGVGALFFDPDNLRITGGPGAYRIAWLVPGVAELELLESLSREKQRGRSSPPASRTRHPVRDAVRGAVGFFRSLLPAGSPIPAPIDAAPEHCADMAGLARLLLSLAAPSPALAAAVEDMPTVQELPPLPLDWDAIIAEGEALLLAADEYDREYVAPPLAAAYHQRASRTAAGGDPAVALRDAERAAELDPILPHATTRAVLLDRLGRHAEAREALDRALSAPPESRDHMAPFAETPADSAAAARDRARALGVRGTIALRRGEASAAEPDLLAALGAELPGAEAALYAHGLGAARYARGDFAGAAEAETRSVTLAPENTRYRWALVGSLRKLGRHRDARAHAESILAREPDAAEHRARFARLFG